MNYTRSAWSEIRILKNQFCKLLNLFTCRISTSRLRVYFLTDNVDKGSDMNPNYRLHFPAFAILSSDKLIGFFQVGYFHIQSIPQ